MIQPMSMGSTPRASQQRDVVIVVDDDPSIRDLLVRAFAERFTVHALEDVGIMSMLPGMEVFVPCDPGEVEAATRLIAGSGGPSDLRPTPSGAHSTSKAPSHAPSTSKPMPKPSTTAHTSAGPTMKTQPPPTGPTMTHQ